MQSSRYVTGTMADARRVCSEDTELLRSNGFQVIRQKIEAVSGITQVRLAPLRAYLWVCGCVGIWCNRLVSWDLQKRNASHSSNAHTHRAHSRA